MRHLLAVVSLLCLLLPQAALAATQYVAASYAYDTSPSGAAVCWRGSVVYYDTLAICKDQLAKGKAAAKAQNVNATYPDECKAVTAQNYTIKPDKNVPDCATYDANKNKPTPTATTPAQTKTTDSATPTGSATSETKGFVPLTNIQNVKFAGNAAELPDFLNSIYMICIGLAAVIGVLQIMRAGVTWMTAGGSHEKVGEAKNLVRDTIIGLVLVLAPTIVFSIINPSILELKINGLGELQIKNSKPGADTPSGGTGTSQNAKGGSDGSKEEIIKMSSVDADGKVTLLVDDDELGDKCIEANGGYSSACVTYCKHMKTGELWWNRSSLEWTGNRRPLEDEYEYDAKDCAQKGGELFVSFKPTDYSMCRVFPAGRTNAIIQSVSKVDVDLSHKSTDEYLCCISQKGCKYDYTVNPGVNRYKNKGYADGLVEFCTCKNVL